MIQLICLFSPAFLAVATLQEIWKEPLRGWDLAFALAIFAGVINMLSAAVIAVLFGHPDAMLIEAAFSTTFTFKYLALSFVFALVLPYVYDFLRRTVKIELSIQIGPALLAESGGVKADGPEESVRIETEGTAQDEKDP